jgi:hypothetical protein
MKKILLLFVAIIAVNQLRAQGTFCNPAGNLMLITNYDGGVMNINVDVNISNIKIGIVTYEAVQINLSGTFVNNVTEVRYAGYNGNNDNCGTGVTNTSINGAPGGATTSITLYPPVTLANPNGYGSIICGYSCDLTTNQGGCNTADQIESYWASVYPGSSLNFHRIQYSCIGSTINLSTGGNCCALATPLSALISVNNTSCNGSCDGSATASAAGGQPPYSYQWSGGPATATYSGLCAGSYTVFITDSNGGSLTQQITVNSPAPITATSTSTPDNGTCNGSITVSPSGGTAPYTFTWPSCGGLSTTATANNVCAGICCVTITDVNGCIGSNCDTVSSISGINEALSEYATSIYPNPSEDGFFTIQSFSGKLAEMKISVVDVSGRKINYYSARKSATYAMLQINATPGLYYVIFETPSGEITRKVVVK